ncbi:MAG: alpha/beta hydrolase [Nocardiopsaceae bacterium]|nr:alpha/beta hydrolase [Nocardiopsaceae bacterium]
MTVAGPALAEGEAPEQPELLLVLTHGAGGGVASKDVLAAKKGALAAGAAVVLVTQPYRVRGASAPGSATRQDAAWLEIIGALREKYPGLPLVQGGRSNGARVACRTAQQAGATAVIALAFPLHPPGKADDPARSRAGELRDAGVPVLVINGERDPFGIPEARDTAKLVVLPGETHSLSGHSQVITTEVETLTGELVKLARRTD